MKSNYRFFLMIGFMLFACMTYAQLLLVTDQKTHNFQELLADNGISYKQYQTIDEALANANRGDGLMVLAGKTGAISKRQAHQMKDRELKVYVEYPSYLTSDKPEIKKINLERGVISSNTIAGVAPMSIVTLNDQYFYCYTHPSSIMSIAKVAGFDKAEYGLTDTESYPGMFQEGQFLVSSVALSNQPKSRFGPTEVWNRIWQFVFRHVGIEVDTLILNVDVRPTFERNAILRPEDFTQSISRGLQWYQHSKLLIHEDWVTLVERYTKKNGEDVVFPAVPEGSPIGDGSLGILEGHASYINQDGTQPIRWWIRADCQAETAFAFSSGYLLTDDKQYASIADNLLQYLYKTSNLRGGERSDPASTSFGLIGWATTDPDAYYGDDNARVLLATIGASSNLKTETYFPYIIEGILGNFRTSGKSGFRGPWFRDAKLQTLTWQELFDSELTNIHPHYECWLWANYLWLYDKTGYEPLKTRAVKAIQTTMNNFPIWKWTNGIQQEYARMLLPLAWLVRIEDNELHRYWLKMVANTLLQDLDECGAIKERLGIVGLGRYDKVRSNAQYGVKEAPLISEYGDEVTDLLYTLNYASFGLNEALAATQDTLYKKSLDKINSFFVKAQVRSEVHPDLDGAWFRAFDFNRWDYWASNADSGWGPWGTQTGWTQSWVLNSLMSHIKQTNFWDTTQDIGKNKKFQEIFENRKQHMLKLN
jgi:hypothetical protein